MGEFSTMDTYINATTIELLEYKPFSSKCSTISTAELQALNNLQNNSDLVTKPADKGWAIVLMNKQDYIRERLRQLNDTQFYKEPMRDPTNKNVADIQKFLNLVKAKQLLPNKHINFITPKNCRTPLF